MPIGPSFFTSCWGMTIEGGAEVNKQHPHVCFPAEPCIGGVLLLWHHRWSVWDDMQIGMGQV